VKKPLLMFVIPCRVMVEWSLKVISVSWPPLTAWADATVSPAARLMRSPAAWSNPTIVWL
jgi:hypothetical protein